MPQSIIPGPLRVSDLTNHRRLDPTATSHFGGGQALVPSVAPGCREIRKGATLNSDLLQLIEERSQRLFAETRSDPTGELKALAFVKANQQSAEMFPRPFGLGKSADNEFLLLVELDLDPCSGAFAGFVTGTATQATSPAAVRRAVQLPQGSVFSANTQSATTAIQRVFIKPPTKERHIKPEQQPRQETPCCIPCRTIAHALW